MTSQEETICANLRQSSELANDEDYERYVAACRALPVTHEPEVLRVMLGCLNDNEAGEIQYELVEACERFPDRVVVEEVSKMSAQLEPRAGEWFWIIFQSIMNTPSTRQMLAELYRIAGGNVVRDLDGIFDRLVVRDSRYGSAVLLIREKRNQAETGK
jgi:hypothetical protein